MKVELVTTLKRQAIRALSELLKSKGPVLITEHGKPLAYLVEVDHYAVMQNRMNILEGLSRGETAIQEGRTFSQAQARDKMSKWLK